MELRKLILKNIINFVQFWKVRQHRLQQSRRADISEIESVYEEAAEALKEGNLRAIHRSEPCISSVRSGLQPVTRR